MAYVHIEDLLKRCGSVYRMVILAAKRAKEVSDGANALVETDQRKATTIALEEIIQGKVLYKAEEEPAGRSGKKGRATKGKAKRKAT